MQRILFSAGAVLLAASIGTAQSRPDFSGTWIPDSNGPAASSGRTIRPSGGGGRAVLGGGPVEYRIAQTDTTLTIERTRGSNTQRFAHTFDGTENVNVNDRTTLRTKSRWDGDRLVTEGTQTVRTQSGEITVPVREVRSIAADGSLVVETTRTVEGQATTSKQVYTRKKN